MFKRNLALLLIGSLMFSLTVAQTISAQNKPEPEAAQLAKLKAKFAKFGTGKQAKIEVTLRDQSKRSGHLSQINESSIALTDTKTGANTEIPFADIADARKTGLSKGAKIALITAGVAVIVVVIFFKTCGNPDFCG